MPLLLPWLAILILLILPPNRRGEAWWIWLPLGCVAALALIPASDWFSLSPLLVILLDVTGALAFGFAAVWLLSSYLGRQHRFLTLLCVLPVLAVFSAPALVARGGWDPEALDESFQTGILLAVSVAVISVALTLAGLLCRSRYRPASLYVWLLVSLTGVWLVVAAPFFVFVMIASPGQLPWLELFTAVLVIAAVSFASLLPFLILSSCSPLFRERLKALLHLDREAPPPVIVPPLNTRPQT